ncbi:MAG: hypothetical protein KAJ49_01690 [Arcobacteraceae bacterium]|nr:hypothetical protein [Arcobacteraceae bacterium]
MENTLKLMELFLTITINSNEIIIQNKKLEIQNNKILQHLNQLELNQLNPKIVKFNIDTQSKASKILNCSIPTLKKAIENNILIENIHYKFNGKSKYFFSSITLEQIKGKI